MRHIDPDILALLALGENAADSADRAHLAECDTCSAELVNFGLAVSAGRSTIDAAELIAPSPRVWGRISDDLGLDPEQPAAPVTPLVPRRRRWMLLVAAAAGVALVASGGLAAWQLTRPAPTTVLATATLEPFPDWPDAIGEAVVEVDAQGTRVVQVTLDAPPLSDDFTEVWLISSDATRLISLGNVTGTSGTFTIPRGIDLSVYDLVDISVEPYDGNPAHSGNSIVRGQLS